MAVPLGVRRLQTFCRNVVSTNAAGGPLIPTVLSLLSTSKMMTSKDLFSLVKSEEKTKKHHHSHFLEVLICRFCVLRHLPSFSSALMRSRPSPSVTVKRSSGLKPNHSLATSNTTGSSSTTSMETLGTKSRRNWAKPPPPSPTRSTDTGPPERGDRTGAHLLGS